MQPPQGPPQTLPTQEAILAPRIKIIDDCDFPIIERDINGYEVLVIPSRLRDFFDKEDFDAVRINSIEPVKKFPVYGGKTTTGQSLLPHQDHLPNDKRRFLTLSKNNNEARGSTTYITRPETVRKAFPEILNYVNTHLDDLRAIFVYNPSFTVSEAELLKCFVSGGLDDLVVKKIGANTHPDIRLFAYLGILSYMLQGEYADELVAEFLKKYQKEIISEEWNTNGTLIIDNSKVFHGRFGNNQNPLQRNWLVAE